MTIILYSVSATMLLLAVFAGFHLSCLTVSGKTWEKALIMWVFLSLLGSSAICFQVAVSKLIIF